LQAKPITAISWDSYALGRLEYDQQGNRHGYALWESEQRIDT